MHGTKNAPDGFGGFSVCISPALSIRQKKNEAKGLRFFFCLYVFCPILPKLQIVYY